ncbi:hypothetical protein OESDEN_14566 [Oesophagostomum dentatum]|uniref:Ras modification protein ERF4 n=1 Tax=Oesophagostomum dentatum TaxID=61180 RepID=A0A0B1SPA3_OESDE|nr:hypothetical protein OESDEN_14566 [Oesophagostomum dentatum]
MVMASPPQPTKNGVTVHEMKALRLESCRKIFIPRDYAHGLNVHFETQFPLLFRGKISEQTWENTVDTINSIFAEAEKVCFATIAETILGCITCYCSRLVADTIYQKKMMKLSEFLDRENQETYNPAGFHILSPMERGLRTIEIWVLSDYPSDPNIMGTERTGVA